MRRLSFVITAAVMVVGLAAGRAAVAVQAQAAKAAKTSVQALREQIVAKERQELDALKSGNTQEFASLIAEEAVFVDPRGTASKAEVVGHIGDFKLLEFSMDDIKFVALSETSGVIAYKLTEKGTSHGREFTSTAYASAVWVQRDGKWVCVFSQETPGR
jgi:hypothetical protein